MRMKPPGPGKTALSTNKRPPGAKIRTRISSAGANRRTKRRKAGGDKRLGPPRADGIANSPTAWANTRPWRSIASNSARIKLF